MPSMTKAAFVLAGGASRRMGRNKATLPFGEGTLLDHLVKLVAPLAGAVSVVGDPALYGHLGYPVIADVRPGEGPLAGIEAALLHTTADWNLVVACDMPLLESSRLKALFDAAAAHSTADVILPVGPTGRPEPLCALYHQRALLRVSASLDREIRKVTDGLRGLTIVEWPVEEARWLANANTPEDWRRYSVDGLPV